MATRKSTPKHEVVSCFGTVILTGVSRTEAESLTRSLNKDTRQSMRSSVRPVKRQAA
jgi:hypothetical protein